MNYLEVFWNLQELDLQMQDIEKKLRNLPLLKSCRQKKNEVEVLTQGLKQKKESLHGMRTSLRRGEMRLQSLTSDIASLHSELYGGKVANLKELAQIEKKMEQQKCEKEKLEDRLLEDMDQMEQRESAYKERTGGLRAKEKELAKLETEAREKVDELKNELLGVKNRRKELAACLDPVLLKKHEAFSQKFNGKGIALVTGKICGGCRIELSACIKERLYEPGKEVFCESCGRILLLKSWE